MDHAPSKRRKTSPTTSVNVSDDNTQLLLNAQHDGYHPGRRASYMAPTKASLARFNPGLLPLTGPTPPRRRGSSGSQAAYKNGLSATSASNGHTALRAKSAEPITWAGKETLSPGLGRKTSRYESETIKGATTPSKRVSPAVVNDIRASPPEEAKEGHEAVGAILNTGQTNMDLDGDHIQLHEPDKTTAVLPIDQPHVPSTPSRQGHQRLPLGMGLDEDGEPSLPSTPVQLGLEKPPEPPKGLLSMSPSRRSKRTGPARLKSSPLKPPTDEPLQRSPSMKLSNPNLGPRVYIDNTPKPAPTAQEAQLISIRESLATVEGQLQEIEGDLVRKLLVSDWEVGNDKNSKEILRLEKEASMESSRVLRIRQELQQFESASDQTINLTDGQIQNSAGVDRSSRQTGTNDSAALSKATPLSQRLARFLLFSRSLAPPALREISPGRQGRLQTMNFEVLEAPITPFTITTIDSVLLPSSIEIVLLQSQLIVLSSPCQSLCLKLRLVVDVVLQSPTQLEVIELSEWAEEEFGVWLRASLAIRSIAAIGTAFGRYWMVCLQRLRSWGDAVRKCGDLISDHADLHSMSWPPTSADLFNVIPHLCWPSLHMSRDAVTLVINWSVTIDNNGNVRSDVSALPSFPNRWRQSDAAIELEKVGKAFKLLLDDKGATEAICVVAGLLFPSEATAES